MKKTLKIIALSALNACQIGFIFFIFAFIISFCLSGLIDPEDLALLPLVVISGGFWVVFFIPFWPLCYIEAKKGKSYPFIKFTAVDFFETLSRAFFEGF